ncbi:MAG: permease prefix domain 1-containing protein [Longimicrobiales bacterium]
MFRQDPTRRGDEELRYPFEESVREYVARGMDPEAARRAALDRLGDLEHARGECAGLLSAEWRADERRALVSASWLDVKLGVRMHLNKLLL